MAKLKQSGKSTIRQSCSFLCPKEVLRMVETSLADYFKETGQSSLFMKKDISFRSSFFVDKFWWFFSLCFVMVVKPFYPEVWKRNEDYGFEADSTSSSMTNGGRNSMIGSTVKPFWSVINGIRRSVLDSLDSMLRRYAP